MMVSLQYNLSLERLLQYDMSLERKKFWLVYDLSLESDNAFVAVWHVFGKEKCLHCNMI